MRGRANRLDGDVLLDIVSVLMAVLVLDNNDTGTGTGAYPYP